MTSSCINCVRMDNNGSTQLHHEGPVGIGLPTLRRNPVEKASPFPFSVVTKPTGAACNLECEYCFFLSKELLYDDKRQRMSQEGLERYIQTFLASQPDGPVTMLWQGGEPTLRGLDFFKAMVRLVEQYRRPEQIVSHSLQTNATLINEDWATFFAENNFLVGVSFDGPQYLHDVYRVNKGHRGTYAMVERGWRILQEHNVDLNILCTVSASNQDHPEEVYTHFRDVLGARYMQFIPIVERVNQENLARAELGWTKSELLYQQHGTNVTSRTVDPTKYGAFLSRIFDAWARTDIGEVFVQDFDSALSALFSQATVCVHAPECGNNFAMEFNGDVYACDHWVEPDYLLGNIQETNFNELAQTQRMQEFSLKKKAELTEQCLRCPVRNFCNGGCPKDRFVDSVDGQPRHNYLCPGYYTFFTHAEPTLRRLAHYIQAGMG
ncbi:MAG: anaerobic sulfatase maturase [Corynebacterium sp.]|nr:anaerobic sulfatase maturase [Corynebacterium sp.]